MVLRKVVLRKHHFAQTPVSRITILGNRCVQLWLCTGRFPDQSSVLLEVLWRALIRVVHICETGVSGKWCLRKVVLRKVVFAEVHFRKHRFSEWSFRESPVYAYALYIG